MQREYSPVDWIIAELAGRQYGIVAKWQLVAAGIGASAIEYRLRLGRLHLLHEGVYAVGHRVIPKRGWWMAAALAFGEGAVLSHITAGQAWRMLRWTDQRPHVTSAARSLVGRPGITLHRVRSLAPELTADGLPVTTVERVLLDLAGEKDTRPLRRAWERAQRERLLDVRKVIELIENSPGRRVKPLRALIAEATDAPDTRGEFEDRPTDSLRERLVAAECLTAGKPFPQGRRPEPQARSAEPQARSAEPQGRQARAVRAARPEPSAKREPRRLLRTAPSPTRAGRAVGA